VGVVVISLGSSRAQRRCSRRCEGAIATCAAARFDYASSDLLLVAGGHVVVSLLRPPPPTPPHKGTLPKKASEIIWATQALSSSCRQPSRIRLHIGSISSRFLIRPPASVVCRRLESYRPSQPVRLQRLTYEGRSPPSGIDKDRPDPAVGMLGASTKRRRFERARIAWQPIKGKEKPSCRGARAGLSTGASHRLGYFLDAEPSVEARVTRRREKWCVARLPSMENRLIQFGCCAEIKV
jgi:hypothetical protein